MFRFTFKTFNVHKVNRANKFWAPVSSGVRGQDIGNYNIMESLKEITANDVTCQVNGVVGDRSLVEDFFLILLTGFDVLKTSTTSTKNDSHYDGDVFVRHSRNFIGWQPTNSEYCFPYHLVLEGQDNAGRATHVTLNVPLGDSLKKSDCPIEVVTCVNTPEAMKMLVALRRIRVKSEVISYGALMSASKKKASWCDALGVR
eukprot:Tbor_TRINITY_DN4921_c0_g1::TRINITY_DN4921_c0_g1_i2::g.9985::m.9985